jgi:hypothetical protein
MIAVKRSAFFCVFVAASASIAACDLPAATFDATTTTSAGGGSPGSGGETTGPMHTTGSGAAGSGAGGTGAGGSTTGGTGGATTTTTTTTSGGGTGGTGGLGGAGGVFMGPVVPCGTAGKVCKPYEFCCNNTLDHDVDKCSGTCDTNVYGVLKCNGPEDCPGGKCCVKKSTFLGVDFYDSECKATCPSGEQLMCDLDNPMCTGGKTCAYMLSGYPGYGDCQ